MRALLLTAGLLLLLIPGCIRLSFANRAPGAPGLSVLNNTATIPAPCTLVAVGTDPDGDRLAYQILVDEGYYRQGLDWTSYFPGGRACTLLLTATYAGEYDVAVRARDTENDSSPVSEWRHVVFLGAGAGFTPPPSRDRARPSLRLASP